MAFTPATFRRATIAVAGTAVALGALPVAAAATPAPVSHAQVSSTKADRAKLKRKGARERANRARASLVRVALNQKGERYVSGASGPNRFDCSGFTYWVTLNTLGKDIGTARERAYAALAKLRFDGAFHRRDIGYRALSRE